MNTMNTMNTMNSQILNIGRIDIIMGCMFSGKSSELIKIINRYKVLNKKILIVNHLIDIRYNENCITTHNQLSEKCISINNLSLLKTVPKYNYLESEVIVIEEAQFFNDLYEFVKCAAEIDNKIVIVAGLDGDSNRDLFGEILKLIPLCDTVIKLSALCIVCKDGTIANFSKRIIDNKEQICVGSDEFIPVCRHHYLH